MVHRYIFRAMRSTVVAGMVGLSVAGLVLFALTAAAVVAVCRAAVTLADSVQSLLDWHVPPPHPRVDMPTAGRHWRAF